MNDAKILSVVDSLTDEDISCLTTIKTSRGYALMRQLWETGRENIISEGKICRDTEDRVQMWAELDGFDKAAQIMEFAINEFKKRKQNETDSVKTMKE